LRWANTRKYFPKEGNFSMSFMMTVLLGAVAGFTIYLGLPIARLKQPAPTWQAFLNAAATGILVFLFWDIITKATEPLDTALTAAQQGKASAFIILLSLFAGGFGLGLLSLVYFEDYFLRRTTTEEHSHGTTPAQLAFNCRRDRAPQLFGRVSDWPSCSVRCHQFSDTPHPWLWSP
jgi:hypothetical protein